MVLLIRKTIHKKRL